jgi:aryl carrier-like protein
MFNTLPQPLRNLSDVSLKQHVRDCHKDDVAVLLYQHTSLRDIRKWTGQLSADPMFDVLFVFQHSSDSTKTEVESLMQEIEQEPQAHYPLSCEVEWADNGKITVQVVAQSEFFDQESVQRILDSINEVLQCMPLDADANISDAFGVKTEPTTPSEPNDTLLEQQVNGVKHFEWTPPAVAIRAAIASLLNLDPTDIDEHSTIFTLGLDSIDAVKLTSRLRRGGLSISVSKILQAQTIPRILQTVQTNDESPVAANVTSKLSQMEPQLQSVTHYLGVPENEAVERILPATPAQEALIADMYRTELREYFNHDVLHLGSNTELHRLKGAWQMVVDHSPILRTMFLEVSHPDIDSVFAQVVLKSTHLAFEELEARGEDGFETIFESIRMDVLSKIREKPPLRLTLIKIRDEHYLLLSLAHAQYDGYSLALLHDDVQRAYQDSFVPRPPYNDAIEAALTAVNDEALRFWTDALSGTVARPFPHLGSDAEASKTNRAEQTTMVSSSATRAFCKSNGISMQALAQTCWALTLAHYTRSMEVMFGVVLACRDSKDAEDVMFPMMNTVVMRASLHGSRAQMVKHMQSLGVDMLPYRRTPLRAIQAAAGRIKQHAGARLSINLFDTIFIYQHKPQSQGNAGTALYESVGGSSDVEYPVAVEMEASDSGMIIRGACRGSVLDQLGTEQLLETVEEVLAALIHAPDEPTVDFDGSEVSICGMDSFYLDDLKDEDNNASEQRVEGDDASADMSPTISAIVEAFAQVSKVSRTEIGSSTTIESISIDSISAIKVAALLRKQDIHLSVSEILRAKTASRMAKSLETRPASNSRTEQSTSETISRAIQPYIDQDILHNAGIDPNEVETVLPATAGQVYMLIMWQKTAGQLFYSTFRYQLDADVESEDVHLAWKNLTTHHPILRTIFCATGDINIPVLQVVLRASPDSMGEEQQVTMGAAQQPMVSLQLHKNDAGYELKLKIHHALYDAISFPILMHDLASLVAGKPPSTPKLKIEDFIASSVTHRSKQLRKHFWSDYLDDINHLSLAQPQTGAQHKRVEIFKPALFGGVDGVEKIARKENLSLQSILFAAYAKIYANLAAKACGESEPAQVVALGIYLSNRAHRTSLETLAAPTVNLVPLLIRSPLQNSLLEVARRVQEDLQKIGTVDHSTVGLWEVERWTGVKVDTFVNFLKLPGTDADDAERQREVQIKAVDGARIEERSRVVEPGEGGELELPRELEGMKGADAYEVKPICDRGGLCATD